MTTAAFALASSPVLRRRAASALTRTAPPFRPRLRTAPTAIFDPLNLHPTRPSSEASFNYALFSLALPALAPAPANAVPDDVKEAFKSIPASLVHPGTMWLMFAGSLYAAYLGWQSRSIRSVSPEERKALVKKKVTQRHFAVVSLLAAITTVTTFVGMSNTYTRAGKLFPGPHLYAGLGLVAAFSVTASLVPYMQKGKDGARNAHLVLGVGIVGLFGWQAKTGMDIVAKLLKW